LSITGGNTRPKVLYNGKGEKGALKPSLSTHLLVLTCKLSKQKETKEKRKKLRKEKQKE
jgi:hypothetical protein